MKIYMALTYILKEKNDYSERCVIAVKILTNIFHSTTITTSFHYQSANQSITVCFYITENVRSQSKFPADINFNFHRI